MSTVVVVRKGQKAVIAADTLTSFGNRKQTAPYSGRPQKVFRVGNAFIGGVGSAAHELVLESALLDLETPPEFRDRMEIFELFRELHPRLKERYFLNPKEEDDDPYESSQFNILIASPYGIFGVRSLREVFEFTRFWAIGSGSSYALGALHAHYERLEPADAIARAAVESAIEFDDGSAAPVTVDGVNLL